MGWEHSREGWGALGQACRLTALEIFLPPKDSGKKLIQLPLFIFFPFFPFSVLIVAIHAGMHAFIHFSFIG